MKNTELKISDTGVEPVDRCSAGIVFFVVVNNTSDLDDFDVELAPDQCCLEDESSLNCDVLQAVGNCLDTIPKGKTLTLKLVAPVLDPFERKGYCLANLDSKSVLRKRNAVTMRDAVKIPFDTRLKHLKHDSLHAGMKHCKGIDEDPLNQCKPVDCELFYNGKKSYYSRIKRRCVEVPQCVNDRDDIPNTVYDPTSNACVQEEPITKDDFDYIKGIQHSNKGNGDRIAKDIVIIKKLKEKPPHVPQFSIANKSSVAFLPELKKKAQTEKNLFMMTLFKYMQQNKASIIFLSSIIIVQCALICMMVYYYTQRCVCRGKKKLEHKYFNYRQDVSVTTPLIGATTIDTETTTCQFMSESSHVDRKIQDYKACQKDNAKLSLSDDILSKCVNRRNWDRKPVRSEAVNDTRIHFNNVNNPRNQYDSVNNTKMHHDCSNNFETLYVSAKTEDQKLIYENNVFKDNKDDNAIKSYKNTVKKNDSIDTFYKKIDDDTKSKDFASERELKCFTYQYKDSKPKIRDFESPMSNMGYSEKEILCHSYNYGVKEQSDDESRKWSSHSHSEIRSTSKKPNVYLAEIKNDAVSTGKQVSAQASFTNDSIDDYLSERGITLLAGENISKYSFSDNSIRSVSARTSKSNIMKRVLSYLKREKQGPASEPGKSKNDKEKKLELIHMSKATMYSSSNNGNESLKNASRSRIKDSRTSL
ncbi:hypothetical protein NE865_07155 [Phthorimaea operculella]|nr:hypothetical protein NE865_07155 [Phthorimaea operculella]